MLSRGGSDDLAVDVIELAPEFTDSAVQGERPAEFVGLNRSQRVAGLEMGEDGLVLGHATAFLPLAFAQRAWAAFLAISLRRLRDKASALA